MYYQLSNASDTLIFLPGLAGLDGPRVPAPLFVAIDNSVSEIMSRRAFDSMLIFGSITKAIQHAMGVTGQVVSPDAGRREREKFTSQPHNPHNPHYHAILKRVPVLLYPEFLTNVNKPKSLPRRPLLLTC